MEIDSSLYVEFYAKQFGLQRTGTAHICHCLLRARNSSNVQTLLKGSASLGKPLSRLPYLETVFFESSHELEAASVQPLLESLGKACRVEVQHRTCDEAHKLAVQAKKSPSRSTGGGLVSPFWCLEKNRRKWWVW